MDKNIIKDIRDKTFIELPFIVDNIVVYPKTLKEIFEVSENKYQLYLNILTADINKLLNIDVSKFSKEELANVKKLNTFDALIINYCQDKNFAKIMEEALSFFLCSKDEKLHFLSDGGQIIFYINEIKDNKIINRKNFNKIVTVVKIQNGIEDEREEKIFNPANAKVAQFIEQARREQAKVEAIKNKNAMKLVDLMSILASKGHGITIFNVKHLNMVNFKDQLGRLQLNEGYSIQKYLLGNSFAGESIDLKKNTYFQKLNKN